MPRFIGSKFGDFVGIQTVSGFCDSGVYNYNDQIFLNRLDAVFQKQYLDHLRQHQMSTHPSS